MPETEIYEGLIAWLRQSWSDLPDSTELLPMIKACYSPEEAKLLTGMPFSGRDLEELALMKDMEPKELMGILDGLAARGLVFRSEKAASMTVRYSLNDPYFVFLRSFFWSGGTGESARSVAPYVNRYFRDGFADQYNQVETKGLRTIPINATIPDGRQILPFEDVASVIDSQKLFSVTHCACKHRKNIDPDEHDCKHPSEVCLHFGRLADYIIGAGLGRKITKNDTLEILNVSAEEGLVHGVSNWQTGVDTICNCCKCCCVWFEPFHVLGHSRTLDASNYVARIKSDTCSGCGKCVKRCPMTAIGLHTDERCRNKTGKIAVLKKDLCLGCGVCAYKCPTNSVVLERRPLITHPPDSIRDNVKRFMEEREAARVKIFTE